MDIVRIGLALQLITHDLTLAGPADSKQIKLWGIDPQTLWELIGTG